MRRPVLLMGVALAVIFSFNSEAEARGGRSGKEADVELGAGSAQSGIRTDRLSDRQLRIWRKIERVALARDASGRPMHPTLDRLWRQLESSDHRIFVELRGTGPGNMGGKFAVEKTDPEGLSHDLSIRLYLSSISQASTKDGARRADGFIPFKHLYGINRYAEALGHEIAHAVLNLLDPRYTALVEEQNRLEAELVSSSRRQGKVVLDTETTRRMRRLDVLARLIEAPANAAEAEVWRELVARSKPEGLAAKSPLMPTEKNTEPDDQRFGRGNRSSAMGGTGELVAFDSTEKLGILVPACPRREAVISKTPGGTKPK